MDGEALAAELPAGLAEMVAAEPELARRLLARIALARAEHPALVSVSDARFVAYCAARLGDDASPTALVDDLHHADLLLACACASGDPAGIRSFRDTHLGAIRATAGRNAAAGDVEELCQRVMQKLFVGDGERQPAIGRYSGRGSLAGWLKVLVVREAHDSHRKRRDVPVGDAERLADRAMSLDDPEIAHLKRRYRSQFKLAFQRAFAELSTRERNILRLECLDGLNIDRIGALYGVHRATVARWRTAARQALHESTRRIFLDELRVSSAEFESILRLIESQLDVSLPRLLGKPD